MTLSTEQLLAHAICIFHAHDLLREDHKSPCERGSGWLRLARSAWRMRRRRPQRRPAPTAPRPTARRMRRTEARLGPLSWALQSWGVAESGACSCHSACFALCSMSVCWTSIRMLGGGGGGAGQPRLLNIAPASVQNCSHVQGACTRAVQLILCFRLSQAPQPAARHPAPPHIRCCPQSAPPPACKPLNNSIVGGK